MEAEQIHPISKSRIIITFVTVVLIIFAFFKYTSTHKTSTEVVNDEQGNVVSDIWPSTETRVVTIDKKEKYYKLDISYPEVRDANISKDIKSFVDDQIAQFESDTAWAIDPSIAPSEASALMLDISYTKSKSQKVETYIFSVGTYTGGAHGMQFTKTFSYASTGKKIVLSDLFTDEVKALKAVSEYVKKDLYKKEYADQGMISDGTAPREENYQSFIVTDEGITFIFDPYQVAAYAYGTQKVSVPVEVFKSFANSSIFIR
jgi:biopolymer transport protein ExbD